MKKLSIIIPVYNVMDYLEKCVFSLQKINVEKEIILVDDGSKDDSGRLCDELKEKYADIIVIHQENGGLSAARNTGISNSSGDYLLFLDSDDFLDETETNRIIDTFDENVAYLGYYNNYYADTETLEKENDQLFDGKIQDVLIDDFLTELQKHTHDFYVTAWRFIVKREFILENELFFRQGIVHEDEEWTQRLFSRLEKIKVTNCYFYNYLQKRSGSIIAAKMGFKQINDKFTILNQSEELFRNSFSNAFQDYLLERYEMVFVDNICHYHNLNHDEKKKLDDLYDHSLEFFASHNDSKIARIVRIMKSFLKNKMTVSLFSRLYLLRNRLRGQSS